MFPQQVILHGGYRHAQLADSNYELASARRFCNFLSAHDAILERNKQNGYRRALLAKSVYFFTLFLRFLKLSYSKNSSGQTNQ